MCVGFYSVDFFEVAESMGQIFSPVLSHRLLQWLTATHLVLEH
jgi:hypothetical protein